MGDSPENARGTDSHGFADLMVSIMKHVALTVDYPDDDPMKFSLATPKHCYAAMERCWSIIPGERIVQDILDWDRILEKIIAADGCVIRGEALRSGRRARRADDNTTDLKSRYSSRNRKSTMMGTPMHPDAMRGYQSILKYSS